VNTSQSAELTAKANGGLICGALLSLLIGLVLAIIVVCEAFNTSSEVMRLQARASQMSEIMEAIEILKTHLVDIETGERGFVITGDHAYLAPYHSALEELNQHQERLNKLLSATPEAQLRLQELSKHIKNKLIISKANVITREQSFDDAKQLLVKAGGIKEMNAIRTLLESLSSDNKQALYTTREMRAKALDKLKWNIALVMLVLVVELGYFYFREIRETKLRKALEIQTKYLATHDELTGLPNRRLMIRQLEQAIHRCARHRKMTSVLFLDLNGFKAVNDLYGHHAGDKLLGQVAIRLMNVVRASDMVARLGGDEFVVLTEDVASHADVCQIVAKIDAAIKEVFILEDTLEVQISTSIGVALYPEDGNDIDELLGKADAAMYEAKRVGSSCFCHVSGSLKSCMNDNFS